MVRRIGAVLPLLGLFFGAVLTAAGTVSGIAETAVAAPAPAAVVTDIRVGEHRGATRVVFDVSRAVTLKLFTLAKPYRVVLDLPVVGWQLPQRPLPRRVGLLDKLRYGLFEPGTTRVVIDIGAPAQIINARILAPTSGNPHRIVLDLAPTTHASFLDAMKVLPATVSPTADYKPAAVASRQGMQGGMQGGMLVPPAKTDHAAAAAIPASSRRNARNVAAFPFMRSEE
ncbi:MAG: AMIN domain-containing protein, partial [Rhodospirillales bacterium]